MRKTQIFQIPHLFYPPARPARPRSCPNCPPSPFFFSVLKNKNATEHTITTSILHSSPCPLHRPPKLPPFHPLRPPNPPPHLPIPAPICGGAAGGGGGSLRRGGFWLRRRPVRRGGGFRPIRAVWGVGFELRRVFGELRVGKVVAFLVVGGGSIRWLVGWRWWRLEGIVLGGIGKGVWSILSSAELVWAVWRVGRGW